MITEILEDKTRIAHLKVGGDNIAKALYHVHAMGVGLAKDSEALPSLRRAWSLLRRVEAAMCDAAPLLGVGVSGLAWGAPDMPDGPALLRD